MKIVTLNKENIETEHICCAFSDKKCTDGYNQKKEWLKKQFHKGFVFKRYDVKHKVFIEYGPAEHAWMPLKAPGYLLINCFWVAGQYKGGGYGKKLLQECLKDSKDLNGIVIVSSDKKRPFLADKKFFTKQGFEICDTAPPYYELLVKKNKPDAPMPEFKKSAKKNSFADDAVYSKGLTVLYSNRCPFTEYYVNTELQEIADSYKLPLNIVKITSQKEAQKIPTANSIYNVFYNGEFLTHEILSKKKFDKIWSGLKK
ncbi:MAG: GNAT family N-acetyltransferase [bacterium]|nr:GNAT family N-acetyltransferase [bacterium]